MMRVHFIAAASAALILTGCAQQPATYSMSVEQAFSKIRDASYSGRKIGDDRVQLWPTDYKIVYNEPNSIEWRFTRDVPDGTYDLVTATFEPVDANSVRIGWDMKATQADFKTIDEERNKKIRGWDSVRRILREHVDSTLTGRPFDGKKVDENPF